jgi:hypothetical protein
VKHLALGALLLLAAACGRADSPASPQARQEPGGSGEESGPLPFAFYPGTYSEGQWVVMPVSFPGGTRAELLFGEDLRPQDLGVSAVTSGGLGGVDRDVYLLYGDGSGIMGSGPLRAYEGYGGGTVEVWDPPDESVPCPNLVYRFGAWFVEVRTCQDDLSEVEEATWARSLIGQENDDGFLVLQALPPLQLTPTGGHSGPQLWLQGESSFPFITVIPRKCDPNRPGGGEEVSVMEDGQLVSFHRIGKVWYADWCAGAKIDIQVESTKQEYVEAAARSLRVRNVTEAEE